MTPHVIKYTVTKDIDFRSDNMTLVVSKKFFTNPHGDPAFEESIDEKNSFGPDTTHVIIIGAQPDVEFSHGYEGDMTMGIIETINDTGSDSVEIICQSLIKVLSDSLLGTDFRFNVEKSSIAGADAPNKLQLYYINSPYLPKSKSKATGDKYWHATPTSDPYFPEMDLTASEWYPYAVYSAKGVATANGVLEMVIFRTDALTNPDLMAEWNDKSGPLIGKPGSNYTWDDIFTKVTVEFEEGDSAALIMSKATRAYPFEGSPTVEVYQYLGNMVVQTQKGYGAGLYLRPIPDDKIKEAFVTENDNINYIKPIRIVYEGKRLDEDGNEYDHTFRVQSGIGLDTDYTYVGSSVGFGEPASDGRIRIDMAVEQSAVPMGSRPFFPLNVYGFRRVKRDGESHVLYDQFQGYASQKIAWRMLNHLGWCREPYYEDMNPFVNDIDDEGNPVKYDYYDSDGLHFDFPEKIYDGEVYREIPNMSSFDASKQSYAYNLKNIADSSGEFLNADISPRIENFRPVWDKTVYNPPTSLTIDVSGHTTSENTKIYLRIPTWVNFGSSDGGPQWGMKQVVVEDISNKDPIQIAWAIEQTLKSDKEITTLRYETNELTEQENPINYTIKRVGSRIFMFTENLDIPDMIWKGAPIPMFDRSLSSPRIVNVDPKYDVEISNLEGNLEVTLDSHIALVDEKERKYERIFYQRIWGVWAGFHPSIDIRIMPNMLANPPEPSYLLEYGGPSRTDSSSTPAIIGRPQWTLDYRDVVNKAVVRYNIKRAGSSTDIFMAFPAPTKQYRYYILRLDGAIEVANSTVSLRLSIRNVNGTECEGIITTEPINSSIPAGMVAEMFNRKVISINVNKGEGDPEWKHFPVAANGPTIYILSDKDTNDYFIDRNQADVTVKSGEDDKVNTLYRDSKELVMEEPEVFDRARDSQASGVKEITFSLPEIITINDAMNFVANTFVKYLDPRDRCVCQVTAPRGERLPMFSYVKLRDYTNFDTTSLIIPYSVQISFGKPCIERQKLSVVLIFKKPGGSPLHKRTVVQLESGDTQSIIATKVAEALLANETISDIYVEVNGSTVEIQPKAGEIYDEEIFDTAEKVIGASIASDRSDLGAKYKIFDSSTVQRRKFKERDLVLMRVVEDSSTASYEAHFGRPVEDTANIINQLMTWVGDIDKNTGNLEGDITTNYITSGNISWTKLEGSEITLAKRFRMTYNVIEDSLDIEYLLFGD